MVTRKGSRPPSGEQRLKELGIKLPVPPEPFGTYVEGVQTGNLLFLTGMLPTEGHGAKSIGHVCAELDAEAGRKAACAALNTLAVARSISPSAPPSTYTFKLTRNHGQFRNYDSFFFIDAHPTGCEGLSQ